MASPAAILQVFVNANTKVASQQLAAVDRQLQAVGKRAGLTEAQIGKFSKGAAAAGVGIAALATAAVVAGKQLYDLGREFDQAYDTIRVRTGATGRELERLKGTFRDVAKDVPSDFENIGVAIGDLNTRLGLTGKPLENMAENMLLLSELTGQDLQTNIKSVARSFVDWEITIPKQTRALNGLLRLSQASGASVAEIADNVQKFGSPLRQLGFSFEEAAAMFANFERAGVNTQTMVPGLRLAISNLTKPTDDLAKRMAQLGIQAGKPDKALRRIFALLSKSSTLSDIDKTSLAMDVFGKRAGADMAEAIKQGRFELDRFLGLMRDGDTIKQAYQDTADFNENMRQFGNTLKVLVEPAATGVFDALTKISQVLASDMGSETVSNFGKVIKATFQVARLDVKGFIDTISGGEERKSILQRLREDTESAMDYLKVATGQEQSLRARQKEAIAGVQKAQQRLNHARKQHGPNSYQASVAEAELAGAMNRSAKAQKRLTRAEQTTGAVRRATKAIITDQVGQIKIEIAQNKKLINQKDRKIELLKREQAPSREIKKLQGQIVDLADKNQNKQGKLNKLILEAANKVGPKFANSLERITTRSARIRNALNELPAPLKKVGGTAETQFDRAGKSAKGFRGAIDRTKKRVNDDLRGMPPVLRSSTGQMWEIFRNQMDNLGTYGKPRVSKRAGGVIRGAVAKFAAGGLVPAAVSPGEMISYRGSSMIVPGRPEPRDSVLMGLPTGARVFTWDGQKRLLEGASEAEALRRQAPHFAKGGIVKPEILGGSPNSNRLANTQVGIVHKRASRILESAQERSRASSSGAAFIGPPPGMAQLGNNAWVDSNTWTVASYLANKFGLQISSNYRSPAHNAAVGGVPNSSHTRGTPSNPGAFDFVPASSAMQSFAGQRVAGIVENLIHDAGSGLHNHIAFFRDGGLVSALLQMAKGGEVVRQAAPILTRRGFDHKAAAGILGNAWGESSWNPGATGYGGGGLFGFTASPVSLADLQAYAASKGKSWTHVPTQIKFMLGHGQPTGMAMRGALNALDTIPATTEKFMTDWERPGIPRLDDRIRGAFMASDIMRKMDLGGKDQAEQKKRDKIKKAKQEARKKAKRKRIARKVARIAALGLEIPGLNDKGKTVNLAGKLSRLEEDAGKLLEQIEIYDREATADWSPAGSEYDQAELSSLIAYYTQLLENYRNQRELVVAAIKILQDRIATWEANIKAFENPTGGAAVQGGKNVFEKKWKVRGWKKAIANARSTIDSLSTKRVDLEGVTGAGKPFEEVFGGFIGDTKFELKQLGATPTNVDNPDSEIADLLRQQLQETQRALAISQAQMPIFQQFMPRFHQGGIVQGPNGAERPVMAQAGEGIFTRDQMRAMGSQNITVVIEDAAIDSNRIRVEVDGVIQDKVSTVRRQGSNRRFTTSR